MPGMISERPRPATLSFGIVKPENDFFGRSGMISGYD